MKRDWEMDFCRGLDGMYEDRAKLMQEVLVQAQQDHVLSFAINTMFARFDSNESFVYQLAKERLTDDGLKRLEEPHRCSIGVFGDESQCESETVWSFNNFPLCIEHLQAMADMNSDNAEAVKEALQEASICQS